MMTLSFGLLCAAVLIGGALAVRFLRAPAKPPHPAVALFHGALGAASLATLLAALRPGRPARGMGTEGFGRTAAALLALAFVLGLIFIWGSWHGKRPAETLIGTHALLALAAFVLLLALIVLA
jgi:hypothetical protein